MKGTIVDPTLASFRQFAAVNDIYAVGHVLSFIFLGRAALGSGVIGATQAVVARCTDSNPSQRFQTVRELVAR